MSEREFDYNLHYRSLPNGVRHLEISIPSAKTSASVAFVKTGSRNEIPEKENGLSHWVEHMVFMGTKNYPNYESWVKAVDHLGAEHDAEAEREYTEFYIFGPPEHTRKSLSLLAEVFMPTFPSKEMKRGKDLVFDEMAKDAENEEELALELFEVFLNGGSPLSNSIYGDEKFLTAFTRRDLRRYKDKWYKGANILVVTAGKIGKIRSLVDEYFGEIPEGRISPYVGKGGYGEPGLKVLTTTKTDEIYFVLGVPGVSRNDENYYPLRVAATIIGGSTSIGTSRLYQSIQVKSGLTYDLSTDIEARSDTGYVAVKGSANLYLLDPIIEKIRKEMFNLASTATKEEIRRAKNFLRGQLKRDFENTLTVAREIGIPTLMFDEVEQPRQILKSIESVRLEDVRRVAGEFLKQEEERLVVVGPVNENLKRVRKVNLR